MPQHRNVYVKLYIKIKYLKKKIGNDIISFRYKEFSLFPRNFHNFLNANISGNHLRMTALYILGPWTIFLVGPLMIMELELTICRNFSDTNYQ